MPFEERKIILLSIKKVIDSSKRLLKDKGKLILEIGTQSLDRKPRAQPRRSCFL